MNEPARSVDWKSPQRQEMSHRAALRAMLALFFLWGFLTSLNDILVPRFQTLFALSYAAAVLVPVVFFTTCFVFAPVASILIERLGYRRTMVCGLLAMACGALMFIPAAQTGSFSFFLAAIGVLGAGITILQAAAAPYIAFLGNRESSPGRFSLTLAFNSLGTMVAPLFGGWLILGGEPASIASGKLRSGALRMQALEALRAPYLFLGSMLLLIAIAIAFSSLPRMRRAPDPGPPLTPVRSIFSHAPLVLGAITAFCYAGAEIGISSMLINFLIQPDILHSTRHQAAFLVSFYWGGAVAGRFFGWHVLRRWRPESILAMIAAGAAVLVAIAVLAHGVLAAAALLSVGLCNALVVPIVVMLSISGLGPLSGRASSLMVAANIGAGVVPFALGFLADQIGVHRALAPVILCYAFVLFYALRGCRGHLLRAGSAAHVAEISGVAPSA